jgi:hypothetical protein
LVVCQSESPFVVKLPSSKMQPGHFIIEC